MSKRFQKARLALILMTALAGCQSKLNVVSTMQLEAVVTKTLDIDAPRYDQKMVVTIQSDQPINVFVYLQKDKAAATAAIDKDKPSEAMLAHKENVQTETFEVTVPAKQAAIVTVQSMTKPANVKVTINGK